MTPQERQVIDGIFERLKGVAGQARDPETERYIADLVRQQPYATYALAQSVYVSEQALMQQQQQIEELQAQLQEAQSRPQGGGGFLSGLFGGGAQQRPQPQPPAYGQRAPQGYGQAPQPGMAPSYGQQQQPAPQAGPWGQPQQPRQGMGFLGTAAAAAAGVAGGMMLGNILSSAMGGGSAQAASGAQGLFGGGQAGNQAGNPAGVAPEDASPTSFGHDGGDQGYSDVGWDSDFDGGGDSYDA